MSPLGCRFRISYIKARSVSHSAVTASTSNQASPAAGRSALEIQGVRQRFGSVLALERVDVSLAPHDRLGIVGPSGCGKSTLLSAVSGLLEPSEGEIWIGGARTARERLARCALMPQRDLLLPW